MKDKETRGKRWKSYCNSICTTCNSVFFVKSARRYCYEDKYNLSRIEKQIRYKLGGRTHIVATSVIETATYKKSGPSDRSKEIWEHNLTVPKPTNIKRQIYILKEACKEFDIDYKEFLAFTTKLYKELTT